MKEPIVLKSDSPMLNTLKFKPFRNTMRRRVFPYLPREGQVETMDIVTTWGATLIAKKGDLLISEFNSPNDVWPIAPDIFDQSYEILEPGICIKKAITMLVPLADVSGGDDDQIIVIHTLEGVVSVRAGDFFLAKGVIGEIWPYPKEKALAIMKPVE